VICEPSNWLNQKNLSRNWKSLPTR